MKKATNNFNEIMLLDWNCNTDETIKITNKLISIQEQLKLY